MTDSETVGITPPKADLVWKAVAYARAIAPLRQDFDGQKAKAEQDHTQGKSNQMLLWKRHQYDHATYEDAVEAIVGEWLAVRGSDDISVILTYMDQMDDLYVAFSRSLNGRSYDEFFDWLVLQGQSVFEAVLATPELADFMEHHSHKTFKIGLWECYSRLMSEMAEIDPFVYYWENYKEAGAVPADFKGRLLDEVVKEWYDADKTFK